MHPARSGARVLRSGRGCGCARRASLLRGIEGGPSGGALPGSAWPIPAQGSVQPLESLESPERPRAVLPTRTHSHSGVERAVLRLFGESARAQACPGVPRQPACPRAPRRGPVRSGARGTRRRWAQSAHCGAALQISDECSLRYLQCGNALLALPTARSGNNRRANCLMRFLCLAVFQNSAEGADPFRDTNAGGRGEEGPMRHFHRVS